jgi:hypothetical protein
MSKMHNRECAGARVTATLLLFAVAQTSRAKSKDDERATGYDATLFNKKSISIILMRCRATLLRCGSLNVTRERSAETRPKNSDTDSVVYVEFRSHALRAETRRIFKRLMCRSRCAINQFGGACFQFKFNCSTALAHQSTMYWDERDLHETKLPLYLDGMKLFVPQF